MNLKKLGEILRESRKQSNLSIRKAAELIGVSHTYLSNLEKATDPRNNLPVRPTIDTLKLISSSYKLDINMLLDLAGYDFVIYDKDSKKNVISESEQTTIAAHRTNDLLEDLPPEAQKELEEYIKYLHHKYGKKD